MKNGIIRFFCITLVLFGFSSTVKSQVQIGFGGIYTMPMGEFRNSSYKNGVGGMFQLYTGSLLPKSNPLKIRLGFGINGSNAGSEKFEVETIDPADNTAKLRYKNNNNAAYWAVRLENRLFDRVAVFGDVMYGTRNLHSLRKLELLEDPEDEYEDETHRITESRRVFYGFGLGFSYYLTNNVMLDVHGSYTFSKSFTYLKMESLKQDLNQICYTYETAKSSDVLTINLGLKFNLVGLNSSRRSSSGGSTSSNNNNSTRNNNTGNNNNNDSNNNKKEKKKVKVKTNPGGGGTGGSGNQ